jgi:dolichol-phosphate mannosyltransferase
MRALSILVLAFNERDNLAGAVSDIQGAAAVLDDYEIVIVNDGSTDGTGRVADCLAAKHADVRVLHHDVNRGLRAGYETGLDAARMERVIWLPADREMTAASICRIFAAVGSADLVLPYHGNPAARPWFRRLLTWVSTTEINLLLGHRLRYYQGTAVYPTALARALPKTVDGFFFCAEMLVYAMTLGLTYTQVPLTHQERTYGVSKAVSWRRIWDAQLAVLRFWWRLVLCRQRLNLHPAQLSV